MKYVKGDILDANHGIIGQHDPSAMPIYLPSGLGSGLAGGDWNVVQGLIGSAIPDAIIVRYEKT